MDAKEVLRGPCDSLSRSPTAGHLSARWTEGTARTESRVEVRASRLGETSPRGRAIITNHPQGLVVLESRRTQHRIDTREDLGNECVDLGNSLLRNVWPFPIRIREIKISARRCLIARQVSDWLGSSRDRFQQCRRATNREGFFDGSRPFTEHPRPMVALEREDQVGFLQHRGADLPGHMAGGCNATCIYGIGDCRVDRFADKCAHTGAGYVPVAFWTQLLAGQKFGRGRTRDVRMADEENTRH